MFLQTKIQTLCKKQENMRCFFNTKRWTLNVARVFMKNLKIVCLNKKDDTFLLRGVFLYKQPDTSQKAIHNHESIRFQKIKESPPVM